MRERRFYGWVIVGAVGVMLTTSAGLGFYALTVYLRTLTDERGFSVSSISGATAVFFVASAVAGVGVGKVIARSDPRWIIGGGTVVAAGAIVLLGRVTELWQVYAVYAVFGAGFASSSLVPGTTLVTRWFHRRRSLALSVASTGISVGGILLTPVVTHLIADRGLRDASVAIAAIYLLGIIPVTALLLRPDPASLGQRPDGDAAPDIEVPAAGTPYRDAIHTRLFQAITAAWTLALLAQVGGIAHLFTVSSERLDRGTATLAVSVLAAGSIVGRLTGGAVLHRVSVRGFSFLVMLVQASGLVLLAAAGTRPAIVAGAAVFGLSVGNVLLLQPVVLADVFGVRDYPRIFSLSQLVSTFGVAAGPIVVGVIRDATSYGPAYLAAAAASVGGLVVLASGGELVAPDAD